jgi:hypothetical protein
MRWRIAVAIAVLGIAGIPAVADGVQVHATSSMHVSVSPGTGSTSRHFAVSFRAGVATGQSGLMVRSYRVTASASKRSGCQWNAAASARPAAKGAMVRVTLSPGERSAWCTGTYKGQVWLYQTVRCGPPVDIVCPQIVIRPLLVGTFTFRVTRG